ncbi:MAG: hypothetical protein RDU20_05505 [Desulfomonilaceae bacterium]|nr:hypothetical protein [Desulfomonilaceae bacterium]
MDDARAPESGHRILIYVPIVHNLADMGALSESVKDASVRKVGRQNWKRKQNLIEKLWDDIETVLEGLSVTWERVRIYQDGLPVSGKEAAIVKDLANSGSRNHRLLLRLMERGAQLMGSESPELLLEEYEMARRKLSSDGSARSGGADRAESAALLQRRDKFIAGRINDTLKEGETGIVFLGMLHTLEPWLAKDIRVLFPIGRPPERGLPGSGE